MNSNQDRNKYKSPFSLIIFEDGYREGFTDGWVRSKAESVRFLRHNLHLSTEAALAALGIESEEQEQIAPLI